MTIMVHRAGELVFANQAGLDLVGAKDLSQVLGRNILEFTVPADRDEAERRIGKTSTEKVTTRPGEMKCRCLDGRLKDIEISGTPIVFEGQPASLAVIQDITERKEAERDLALLNEQLENLVAEKTEGLKSANERLSVILESQPVVSYLGELSDRFTLTYMSERVREFSGFEPEEFLGEATLWEDRIHSDSKEEILHGPTILAEKGQVEREYRWQIADGTYRWFYHFTKIVGGDAAEPHQFVGIWQDITNRKEAEMMLRESEERFRATFEQAAVGIAHTTPAGRFLRLNERFCNFLGYPEEELINLSFRDITHPDDRDLSTEYVGNAIEGTAPIGGIEKRYFRKDGSEVWGNSCVSFVADANGKPKYLIAAITDITDRKRMEERLSVAERKGKVGHWIWDIVADDLSWSDEIYTIFGLQPQEFEATYEAFVQSVHPEDRPLVENSVNRALEEKKPYGIEHRVVLPNGETRIVFEEAEVNFNTAGEPLRMFGTVQDITERKQHEEELAQREEELRQSQKMEAVGQLAGGVAHDFNNLLTAILGYADSVYHDLPLNDPLRQDVREILTAGERGATLVSRLLSFSRKQFLQPEVLDLNSVVNDMDRMLRRVIGEDIELITEAGTGAMTIHVDAGQIDQAILNLGVNARDAMPKGGRLQIQTEVATIDSRSANSSLDLNPGKYVVLSISDTGVGMDEGLRSHIFEPFFTTKEKHKGTGLGLSMVFGFVKQSQGDIEVESKVGEGTTFQIYLPQFAADPDPETESKSDPDVPPGGTETVLLVEDNEQVRHLIQRMLQGSDYSVLVANDCEEAIQICRDRTEPIDMLLTDVVMPIASGPELARMAAPLQPNMSVLYISGYNEEVISEYGVLERDIALLQKPFSKNELLKKMRDVFDSNT